MIAGYIGSRRAAPILADMTRRQESIFGGFYTGIATLFDQQLSRKRVVGSLAHLESSEFPEQLEGSIGLAHSRTDDSGGIEWSQPRFDDESTIASVGVGIGGVFSPAQETLRLAHKLLADGASFRTRTNSEKKNGVKLTDGSVVHGGEVYLLGLARLYRKIGSFPSAVRELGLPSESAGLYLCTSEPDRIYIVNQNQRVVVGTLNGETFVATSRLAFPAPPARLYEIPMNTLTSVSADGVHSEELWSNASHFDFSIPTDAEQHFVTYVRNNPGSSWQQVVTEALAPLWPTGTANCNQMLGHQLLEALLDTRTIEYRLGSTQGTDGQSDIPQMLLFASS